MGIFKKPQSLKVLFVAPEAAPFMKVGGLGEVIRSLPRALRRLGHDARVLIPRYGTLNKDEFPVKMEIKDLRVADEKEDPHDLFVSNVLSNKNEKGETVAYFLENMEFYEKRANVYGYTDDAVRWALLSKGTVEFVKRSKWKPDVIVACDWQTGLIPNYLHTAYKEDEELSKIAVVFSIHNLSYQGMFDHHFVNEMDIDAGQEKVPSFDNPRLLKLNFMRRGIMYADVVNTVSSTYAQEITTEEYGEGLHDLLAERRSRLYGILNGIDQDQYNPEKDPYLEHKYSLKNLDNRSKNKKALQEKFGLEVDDRIPLFGIVSRLTNQKGFNLLMDSAEPLLNNFNFQLIVLGSGDGHLMGFFGDLAKKYPDKVGAHLSYDETLPHWIYGGADCILIPSKFEPSGLTQMEAMRYGAVPLVRKTGGLADSVFNYNPEDQSGTGFVFENFDHYSFFGAMVRAIETYRYPNIWKKIQKRCMKEEFSWDKSAVKYSELFEKALAYHKHQL